MNKEGVVGGILLVHGAWHGAWSWDRVVVGLEARGVPSVAVDLNRGDHARDVEAAAGALKVLDGPIIACGHSVGGRVVTDLPTDRLGALVYIAASIPDTDDPATLTPPTAALRDAMRTSDDGLTVAVDPSAATELFYADCSPDVAAEAVSRLRPHSTASFSAPPPAVPAWRAVRSTYAVCALDRAIDPGDQRSAASRATDVVSWPTGHAPMLSRPDLVVDLVVKLAAMPRGR